MIFTPGGSALSPCPHSFSTDHDKYDNEDNSPETVCFPLFLLVFPCRENACVPYKALPPFAEPPSGLVMQIPMSALSAAPIWPHVKRIDVDEETDKVHVSDIVMISQRAKFLSQRKEKEKEACSVNRQTYSGKDS